MDAATIPVHLNVPTSKSEFNSVFDHINVSIQLIDDDDDDAPNGKRV